MAIDVLIADDSGFSRELLRDILRDDHHVVGTAENGVEAVEQFKEHHPELVVLEAEMPIRDGVETTAAIKDLDPDTNVIVCTSVEDEETIENAFEAGADEYLIKPFREQAVREAVESAFAV